MKKVPENLNAFKNSGNIPVGQLFLKKIRKSENAFGIFGNIPDKAGEVSDFLHMYYTPDAVMS